MNDPEFYTYRNKLPHWRSKLAVYFITWRLSKMQRDLSPEEKNIVVEAIGFFDGSRYDLFSYVVMNDHVHVLVRIIEGHKLEKIVHSWKSYCSHRLHKDFGRNGELWQREYYDRIVRDEKEFLEKFNYIMTNPIRSYDNADDYPWVGHGQQLP